MLDRRPASAGTGDDTVSHNNAQRGFTLAEMMATLAIAAITASLAVPAMKNIVTNSQRTAGTNDLVSTLHAARSIAITRDVQVTICPSSDAEHCNDAQWQDGWIYFVDNDHDRQVDANDEVLGAVNGIANITIRSQDFERFLVFRPNGQIMVDTIAENSGEMLLCDARGPEFSRSLILHVGGKPQLTFNEDPNAYTACWSA
jgi:type IV fimbrial biogenesis protein FimT